MKLGNVKGTKDYLPEVQIIREKIISELKSTFKLFGFKPLDTPALENFDLLSAKYTGGADILKETFTLTDRGNRELGLRYDLTVPFSRVIAQNPQLKFPFKRYQIAKVWRNGPIGLGRYREFMQCDVDTVGAKGMNADAEVLAIAATFIDNLGLKYEIKVNNRKILNAVLDKLKVSNKEVAILVIDKIEKLKEDEIFKEFKDNGISKITAEKILDFFDGITGTNIQKLKLLEKEIESDGINEIKTLLDLLKSYNVKVNFDPRLARGLSFYTGTVFETFLKNNKVSSAIASGGRYDKIIGKLLNSPQDYPAVGISFGLDRIFDALIAAKKLEVKNSETLVFIIPIKTQNECIKISQELRKVGIATEVDITNKGISKNLNYANSCDIPYVIFIGEKELKVNKLKLRDMVSGKEQELSLDKIKSILKRQI
jgi:histidyl-tRNA synthetase